MTIKQKIEKHCPKKKDQLPFCLKVMKYFLCDEDIENYLEIKNKKNINVKNLKKSIKRKKQ